jgi:multisubunit Na+/H+ antiporter MnhG subunit
MMEATGYTLTKLFLQRGIALVYFVAFLVAANQFKALVGERGLLRVPDFIKYARFKDAPSLFYFFPHDTAFAVVAWIGVAVSLLARRFPPCILPL